MIHNTVKRFVAGMLIIAAIAVTSANAINSTTQVAPRRLNDVQTERVTYTPAHGKQCASWFVEQVLPGTSESEEATANLKKVVATL